MSDNITFYLQGYKNFHGNERVRECYEMPKMAVSEKRVDMVCGMVDAGVINSHKDEYAVFSAYAEKNKEALDKRCEVACGNPVHFDYHEKPPKPEPKKEASKSKSKGKKNFLGIKKSEDKDDA